MQGATSCWLQSDAPKGGRAPAAFGDDPGEPLPLEAPVLIVEDEALIAWSLYDMLAEMGFADIRVARDGDEAFELASARHPGLLICDVNLGSGDDGLATAARIRASGWVPVLFITGYAGEEIRERIGRSVSGAPLLRKPIEPGPLARHLRQALRAPKPN